MNLLRRQGLPLPRRTPEDARRELEDEYLAYRLEGEAADVAKCGMDCLLTDVKPATVPREEQTCNSRVVCRFTKHNQQEFCLQTRAENCIRR